MPCGTQPPAFTAAVVSGSSFLSPFDLRRRPTLQPCLRTQPPDSHRISHPPAQPLNQLVTCVANQPSSLALRNSTSGLHRLLSSLAHLSCRPSACAADRPSSLPFELNLRLAPTVASSSSSFHPAFDLRRLPAFRPRFPNSTSDSHRSSHLRLILPVDLWLAPPIDPPAPPSNSPSGSHRLPRLRLRLPIDL